MGLFGSKKSRPKEESGVKEGQMASKSPAEVAADRDLLLVAVGRLLTMMQSFSLDLNEIGAAEFRKQLAALSEQFAPDRSISKAGSALEKKQKTVRDYIQKIKVYYGDRENEFKDIINLLTKAVNAVDTENRTFHQRLYEQSEKLDAIILLDDIKEIKDSLRQQVEQIRKTVAKKEDSDSKRIESLSQQVTNLRVELEKSRNDAIRDGLTGTYNRKAFDERISQLMDLNLSKSAPFSLLLLDIDDFKQINDSYGHPIGDRVLLATAQKCNQNIRKEDFLARYGGEEFAILLPGANLENATNKARQICQSLAKTQYKLDNKKKGKMVSVTVSIGISAYRTGDTVAGLVDRADKALYSAKQAGKNQAVAEESSAD